MQTFHINNTAFKDFLKKAKPDYVPPKIILALDPGETTGVAVFENGQLVDASQLDTSTVTPTGVDALLPILEELQPDLVVYEDYRVYGWKSDTHAWSGLHTPQFIGAIKTLCHLQGIPTYTQMAQQPKQFCTDKRLKEWDYYLPSKKHARDAVRHGTYFMLFNAHKIELNKLPEYQI